MHLLRKWIGSDTESQPVISSAAREHAPDTASWITSSEPQPIVDELIPHGWDYHVLHMANRHYQPPRLGYLRTPFGEDMRIKYITHFLDLRELRVMELGAHEGHHSILIEKMGARENFALEARQENFAKCLLIQEKYGLDRTHYYQINIEDLYRGKCPAPFSGKFDLIFCLGLLYHLPDPLRALSWFARQGDRLFLGTHFVEPAVIHLYHNLEDGVYSDQDKNYRGMWYREGGIEDRLSGMSGDSFWPYEEDLLKMLEDAGFKTVHVLGKDYQNHMPHITLLAQG